MRGAVCVVSLLCAVTLSAGQPSQTPDRIDTLERWLADVSHHDAGRSDAAVFDAAALSISDLQTLMTDVQTLVTMMRVPAAALLRLMDGDTRRKILPAQIDRLRAIAARERLTDGDVAARAKGTAANRLIKRAAMLESDVAMLGTHASSPLTGLPPPTTSYRVRVPIRDGESSDVQQEPMHWDLARRLLDLVGPTPAKDDMVRAWYRATMGYMQREQDYDNRHADRGRELFADDDTIMFLNGALHETFAGPGIQSAMRTARYPAGMAFDIGSAEHELKVAETYLTRAVALNPNHLEARLRLARVTGQLGRHDRAADELRKLVDRTVDDDVLSYHAAMFLGAEEETLGHFDSARVSYQHAAARFPLAQSPFVAISHLE